jgi:hypothetical protein
MSDERRKILIQLDTDAHPSVFDRVVAIDAGADEIFSYGSVEPVEVRPLVHGAIFTRGPKHLRFTAIFIGGSDVSAGEQLLTQVKQALLPQYGLTVSILLDANGANTTAAAAVRAAARHLELARTRALVLGGTGPVGQRVAALLVSQGSVVTIASRAADRAEAAVAAVRSRFPDAHLTALAIPSLADVAAALADRQLVIAAGAAGIQLLPLNVRESLPHLRVAIDLNAVPPLGIEGIAPYEAGGEQKGGVIVYGALGIGGVKMKIHKAAVAKLFERNDQVLDIHEIYALSLTI